MRKTALAAVIASAVVITLGGTTALAFGHSGQNGYHHAASVSCDGTGASRRPQLRSQINRNGERVMRSEEEACRESISMPILSAGSVWSISRITVTPRTYFRLYF